MKKNVLKRLVAIALAMTLLTPQSIICAETDENWPLGILANWDKEAPDFYGNLEYVSDGFFIVYLKENTKENQQIVLDGISKGSIVVFATSTYSYNELKAVQQEINSKDYEGLVFWGVRTMNLASGVREPRVEVNILAENYDETSKKLIEKYGDKVVTVPSGPLDLEVPVPLPGTPVTGPTVTNDVKFKSVKLANKKLQVKWKKYKYAKKYKICIMKNNGKKLVTKITKKTKFTYKIKGKLAKSYTVKVKAYNKNSKGWGVWTTQIVK